MPKRTAARPVLSRQGSGAHGNSSATATIISGLSSSGNPPEPAAQRERETTVEPGGAVVLSNADPNSIIFPSPVQLFVLHLKPMALRPLLRDVDTVFARAIPKRAEAGGGGGTMRTILPRSP